MIEIYLKNNKNYEYNGDMTLEPDKCDFEMELNGVCQIALVHSIDELRRYKYIENDNVIACPTPYSDKQLFRIYNVQKDEESITAYARHIAFDLKNTILYDTRPVLMNGQEALNKLLSGTGFTGKSNILAINTAYYINKNVLEALADTQEENSFINRWGGERLYDNFTININDKIGNDYGVRVEYGKNLEGIDIDENIDNLVTRIIPISKDGITINEKYIDSPNINKYSQAYSKVIEFDTCIDEQKSELAAEIVENEQKVAEQKKIISNNTKKIFDLNAEKNKLIQTQEKYVEYIKLLHTRLAANTSKKDNNSKNEEIKEEIKNHEKLLKEAGKKLTELDKNIKTVTDDSNKAKEEIIKAESTIKTLGYEKRLLSGCETEEDVRLDLKTRCYNEFINGIDLPKINTKFNMTALADTEEYKEFKMLEDVSIGDTVHCIDERLDIDIKARCISLKWDCLTKKSIEIELGSSTSNIVDDLANVTSKITDITDENGSIRADAIRGIINAVDTQFKAQRSIAQKQQVRAMIFEDLDPKSETFGAMSIGTMGFCIASERTADGKDWKWSTFGTGTGFFADYIIAGTMLADRIKGGVLEVGGSGLAADGNISIRDASNNLIAVINKNGIKMEKGSINLNNKFIVTEDGKVTATDGTFKGIINAIDGTFKGTITATGGSITGNMDITGTLNGGTIKGARIYGGGTNSKEKYNFEVNASKAIVRDKFFLQDDDGTIYLKFDGTGNGKLLIQNVVLKLGNKIIIDSQSNKAVFSTPQEIYIRGRGTSTQGYADLWEESLRESISMSDGSTVKAWDLGDVIQFICRAELKKYGLIS